MARHPFEKFLVRFDSGHSIYEERDPGATMYIVQSGTVRLSRTVDDHVQELGIMEKGDFFGEMSILEGLPRTTSAVAVEDAELIEINATTFDKMIRSNIEIAIRLLRKLSIRLREAERKVLELGISGHRVPSGSSTSSGSGSGKAQKIETGVRLTLQEGHAAYAVLEAETLIGRYDPVTELKPDIDLTDADLKRSVSRRHARLIKTGEAYSLVEEIGALNGTFVNGDKLVPGKPHLVEDGDKLGVGMVKLVFRT